MVPGTHTAHDIEVTAESLQSDLERLQIQKQALERELAAVVAHLGSVRRALGALETLMPGAAGAASPAATPVAARRVPAPSGAVPTSTASALPAQQPKEGGDTEGRAASGADKGEQRTYGKLTEQIMEYFAAVGDTDVRARDVAAALGRDTDSGSINAVRSTLDRLVGASRIRRTGRGLYRARRSAS